MADVYGVNRTLKRAGTVNSIEPEVNGGVVRWAYELYTAAALAGGSVIKLFSLDIPAEARIVDWVIDHAALTDSELKMAFGTEADIDEFMAYTDSYAIDKKNMTDDGVAAALGFEVASGTGQIFQITTSGGSTATGAIKVGVAYVCKGR